MTTRSRSTEGQSISKDRFPIPDDGIPAGTRCFKMLIPDDNQLVQTFIGQIQQLAWWFNWQRDPGKNGLLLSKYWYDLMQTIEITEECGDRRPVIDVRLRDCYLEVRRAGSFHWENAGDIRGCDMCGECRDDSEGDVIDPDASMTTDDDCLWGAALSLKDLIVDEIETIWNILEVAVTIEEGLEDWREAKRGDPQVTAGWLETLLTAFSIVAQFGIAVLRIMLDNAKENELACDIFCAVKKYGPPYRYTSQVHDDLISLWNVEFLDDSIDWHAKIALHYITGFAFARMAFRLGLDDCSTDHTILCPDCDDLPWCHTTVFADGLDGWELLQGDLVGGAGIVGEWADGTIPRVGYAQRVLLRYMFALPVTVNTVRIKYTAGGAASDSGIGSGASFGEVDTGTQQDNQPKGEYDTEWEIFENADGFLYAWAHFGFTANPSAPPRTIVVHEIEICGDDGPSPWGD